MANGNRLETMTIEDQLNIFAGIDVNIQVQQMSRGKMRPDVKRAIEIAMKRKKELEIQLMEEEKEEQENVDTAPRSSIINKKKMKETLLPNETSNDENKSNVTTTTSVNNNNNRKFNSSASPRGRRLIVEIPIPYRHEESEKKRIRLQREYESKKEYIFIEDSPLNSTIILLQQESQGNVGQPYEHTVTTTTIAPSSSLHDLETNIQDETATATAVPTKLLGNPFDDVNHDEQEELHHHNNNYEMNDDIKSHFQNQVIVNHLDTTIKGNKPKDGEDDNDKQRRLYSKNEIINNVYGQPFFPQRNKLFPRVAVIRRLPTLEERPPRIAIPVITSEVQQYRWLVSKAGWKATLPEPNKLWGEGKLLIDGNLDTRVHLKMSSDTWVLFDLQKSHSITGFRIYPAWSNGPKKVKIQFAGRESGPFIDAAEFDVDGEDGGSYVVVRWQGKEMQGYRNEGLQTSKFFDAGIVPKGRYFRLFIISSWTGVYGKETEGGGVPEQVVLTEVQFYGRQIQLGLTGIDREACSYGYIYNRDTGECKLAG